MVFFIPRPKNPDCISYKLLVYFCKAFFAILGMGVSYRGGEHNAKDCRVYSWGTGVSAGGLAAGEQQYGKGNGSRSASGDGAEGEGHTDKYRHECGAQYTYE
jgi:hypothetical protein